MHVFDKIKEKFEIYDSKNSRKLTNIESNTYLQDKSIDYRFRTFKILIAFLILFTIMTATGYIFELLSPDNIKILILPFIIISNMVFIIIRKM